MWGLVLCPAIRPGSPAPRVWSLSRWTTREVPNFLFWVDYFLTVLTFTKGFFSVGVPVSPGLRKSCICFGHSSSTFPGEGIGNPLQYSCLENSMDRGAWRATVHGVTKSQTRLRTHACVHARAFGGSGPVCRVASWLQFHNPCKQDTLRHDACSWCMSTTNRVFILHGDFFPHVPTDTINSLTTSSSKWPTFS